MPDEREAPSKADMALLPPFKGLPLKNIIVPRTRAEFIAATADLQSCRYVGFDTESRPTFEKGEASRGPHIVQLTTRENAYIFQLCHRECSEFLGQLLTDPDTVKVGFGLRSDRSHIRRKLGITPNAILDMNTLFRRQGYRREIGVKAAIALVFGQKFQKSKSVAMSNWATPELKNAQLLYAANDAYAAVAVLAALAPKDTALPITYSSAQARESAAP
jgi:ribonuclease D